MWIICCSVFLLSYLAAVLFLHFQWRNIPVKDEIYDLSNSSADISVVVAVKNESANILRLLKSLAAQSLDRSAYEIIIVDDNSTDQTIEIIHEMKEQETGLFANLSIIKSNDAGKKAAITQGIKYAKGEIIVCTDGDCEVGKHWLRNYADFFMEHNAKFVFGPVTFIEQEAQANFLKKFFFEMQLIEFASLVGSGAASWRSGAPNMCNGANIAYKKEVFYELKGFEDNAQLPSGDDEFLMHKIFAKYPADVHFLKSKSAIVRTLPSKNLGGFVKQRLRWASKWEHYTDLKVQLVAFYIFVINLMTVYGLFHIGIEFINNQKLSTINYQLSILLLFRWLLEYLFLKDVLRFMDKKVNLWAFSLLVLIYPFYVICFGSMARFKKTTKA